METVVQTCYRHPDRRAGVRCQRCDRPICPECMRQASVGFHCPDCARAGRQQVARGIPRQVSRPLVTLVLVAVNLGVFVAGMGGFDTRDAMTIDGGLIGLGRLGPQLIGVAEGEWWRIFTSGFLHANLIHVGFNCLLLYQLGLLLEAGLGRVRFALLYLFALLGGALGVLIVSPHDLTVGASGAVFGLMGAAFVALRSRGIDPFSTGIGGLIALNLLITFTVPGISMGGHVGGLLAGAVAGWVLTDLGPRRLRDTTVPMALLALGSVALFGACLLVV